MENEEESHPDNPFMRKLRSLDDFRPDEQLLEQAFDAQRLKAENAIQMLQSKSRAMRHY